MNKIYLYAFFFLFIPVFSFAFARPLTELKIGFTDDIKKNCLNKEISYLGCYWEETESIWLNAKNDMPTMIDTFTHEVGHYLMRYVPIGQYKQLFDKNGVKTLAELKEIAAKTYIKWQQERTSFYPNPVQFVTKPFYKYTNSGNIYETKSKRIISYKEAKRKNAWSKTQTLSLAEPTITPEQDAFFRSITF